MSGWGDEFYAVFETGSGFTVVYDGGLKAYCFARRGPDGDLVSSGVPAHLMDPAALGFKPHERMSAEARGRQVSERRQRWNEAMGIEKAWAKRKADLRAQAETAPAEGGLPKSPPAWTTAGLKVGLTLLVDFADDPATIDRAEIVDFCNGDTYTGYGNNGSIKSYFQDNSGGLLTYTNYVTIYLRAPRLKSYYNDTSRDEGTCGRLLVCDALMLLTNLPNYSSEILPALSALTVDAANQVVACNAFFAGRDSGVWSKGLWPHSWSLASAVLLPGSSKSVGNYQITGIGASLTLGTFCHENGHMLCDYPDIYDYDNEASDSKGGAGIFCLMGLGGTGVNPVQICAYLKRASGWANTIELNYDDYLLASVTAAVGTNSNKFYRYRKPTAATEYFLIENRQRIGRDLNLPAAGVAIWHIDELGDHNNQSTNYNSTHQNYEVTLVQADNQYDLQRNSNSGDAWDLYYSGNGAAGYANEFSDDTGPSACWWDGTHSGLWLRAFGESSATMTFLVGQEPPPFTWTTNNGTITITGYTGSGGAATIPSRITDLPVTRVGARAFQYTERLASVTIPSSVTNIGDYAFYQCTNLNAVFFKGDAPDADYSIFTGNNNATVYYLPGTAGWTNPWQGRPAMLNPAAQYTYAITNSMVTITGYTGPGGVVVIPGTIYGLPVAAIGESAFYNCTGLTSVTIPNTVTSILHAAFASCTGLMSVTIPNSVEDIGNQAFYYCTSLTSVTIPDGVTRIGFRAFYYCTSLVSITIGNRVTNIENGALYYCFSLRAVYFKGHAPSADPSVFTGDNNATVYYLPGTTGWTNPWQGRPAILWNPHAQSIGVRTNHFEFTIAGSSNLVIVIEACTNLANPVWSAVATNTLTGGFSRFSDSVLTPPCRFYRLRSP